MMDNSSRDNILASPGWMLLVLGFLVGQSVTASSGRDTTITVLLSSWQSLVNTLIVPIYSFCVFFYLGQQILPSIPFQLLFPSKENKRFDSSSVETVVKPELSEPTILLAGDTNAVNMTGTYKLISNDNFDGFLAVQGVPWALRGAANQVRPTHKITHVGKKLTIKITGIIESQTTYTIDGPPIETNIRGRIFHDSMRYLKDGIMTTKATNGDGNGNGAYDISVSRRLTTSDRSTLTMTSRAMFKDEKKEDVECIQIFQRIIVEK